MGTAPLPPELLQCLHVFRPVFHAASWESFVYLITGLLLGQAQAGGVRASLLAPRGYNWRRLPDFLRRNRWSSLRVMVLLTQLVLLLLYPHGFPSHLFGVVDGTYLEKMYAQAIDDLQIYYRPHPKTGQNRRLKGHGLLLVAHLYQQTAHRFRAFLLGGLRYLKQATWGQLSQQLIPRLPLPVETHNVFLTDRGLTALSLAHTLHDHQAFLLGRVKRNAVFYLPATAADYKGRGRPPRYGQKFRADAVPKERMTCTPMDIPLAGALYPGQVYRATLLRRGLPGPVELLRVEVGTLPPWLLMSTDGTLTTDAAVWAYYGRSQVEVAIGEGNLLGLDQYRGRRRAGIRRWPMVIAVVHSLLQLLAVGALVVTLPRQNWPWYRKETTVGAIQRRLVRWVEHHLFSHLFPAPQTQEKIAQRA